MSNVQTFLSFSFLEWEGDTIKRVKISRTKWYVKGYWNIMLIKLIISKVFLSIPSLGQFHVQVTHFCYTVSLMFPFSSSSWVKMAISHKMFKIFGEKKNSILTETQTIDVCCLFVMRNIFDIWEKWLPKDVHVLIPRICDYVTWHGKRDLTDVTKLRIFF